MPYLHHTLIHFPVALSLVAALCALVAWVRPGAFWGDAQRRLTYATALAAIAAITTGLLSAGHLIEGGVPEATVDLHRNIALGGTALAILTALVGFIGYRRDSAGLARVSQLGALLAAAVIGGGAHFGGDMLHPGMAPWSDKPHSHGTGAPHGHGGAEPDDGHDHDHGMEPDAGEHAGMAMPNVDAETDDAGNIAAASAADASAADARAPAPGSGHVHQHGPGGQDPPRPAGPRTPPPAGTPAPPLTAAPPPVAPTPPAMTGMPPDHKM